MASALSSSSSASFSLSLPLARKISIGLALLAVIAHLAFGLFYVLVVFKTDEGISLQMSGQAFLESYRTWNTDNEHDSAAYNRMATTALQTGWPHSRGGAVSFYAPAYAWFLAASYQLLGIRLWAVVIPNALLTGATTYLMGVAAGALFPRYRPWAMVLGSLLILANTRLASWTASITPSVLLAFCITLSLAGLALGGHERRSRGMIATGFILGSFTQAGYFSVAIAAGLALLVFGGRTLRMTAILVLAGALLKIGLTSVDWHPQKEDSLRETSNGGILWEANNPLYESMTLATLWERRPGNPWSKWTMSSEEKERYDAYLSRCSGSARQAAFLWIRENPGQYAKLCLVRLKSSLGPYTGMMSPRNRMISAAWWIMVFPAGVYGLFRWRKLFITRIAIAMMLAVLVSDLFVIVEWYLRYRLPTELIWTAYAAAAYAALAAKVLKLKPAESDLAQ